MEPFLFQKFLEIFKILLGKAEFFELFHFMRMIITSGIIENIVVVEQGFRNTTKRMAAYINIWLNTTQILNLTPTARVIDFSICILYSLHLGLLFGIGARNPTSTRRIITGNGYLKLPAMGQVPGSLYQTFSKTATPHNDGPIQIL